MSSTDPFQLLGLNRTTATEAEVKAAYAALLKTTRPEDDRKAFMDLRAAFSTARAIAKGNDARREEAPDPVLEAADTPEPAPQPAAPIKWTYEKHLGWNVANNAFGKLVKDTLEWMLGGGKDADSFVQHIAERLLTETSIDEAAYRREVLSFIVAKSDTEGQRDHVAVWDVFDVTRPDWLNDDLMIALADGLRIFKDKPKDSWAAQDYNVARTLFAPVLEQAELTHPVPDAADTVALFADEQDKQRKDDHGSYFDRDKLVWRDMSPVGQAMQDINALIDKGLWDLADRIKEVLSRDEVQAIDEFQDLDNRLRAKICEATGWHSQDRRLVFPDWLTEKLVLLLDDTFGWSRHFGRNGWERQQYDWLHMIIAFDRDIHREVPGFQAISIPTGMAPAQPPPPEKEPFTELVKFLYARPLWLLAGYFGLRVVQVIYRMAT